MDDDFLKKNLVQANKIFNELNLEKISIICEVIKEKFEGNKKILICGNGGSAAQAAHFEGELIGKYNQERKPLPGISLSLSSSTMSCISNDYGEKEIFSRGVQALGNSEDILFVLSTSGNSENIVRAIEEAKEKKMIIIGLLGKGGGKICSMTDYNYVVESNITARIQEAHIFIIHCICDYLEKSD